MQCSVYIAFWIHKLPTDNNARDSSRDQELQDICVEKFYKWKTATKMQGVNTLHPPQLSDLSEVSVNAITSVTCFLHAMLTEQKEDTEWLINSLSRFNSVIHLRKINCIQKHFLLPLWWIITTVSIMGHFVSASITEQKNTPLPAEIKINLVQDWSMSIHVHTCLPRDLRKQQVERRYQIAGIAAKSLLTGPRLEKSSGNMVKNKSSTAKVTGCLSLLRRGVMCWIRYRGRQSNDITQAAWFSCC